MFQAVLFELEGVLVDTRLFRQRALQETLAHDGIHLAAADCEAYADLPVRSAVIAALRAAAVDADAIAIDLGVLRAERRFSEQLMHGFAMMDGARELVAHLAGRVRLGIVTRASHREATTMLVLSGLEYAFECVVTSDSTEAKPDAAPYAHAMRTMSRLKAVAPAAVLALEDGPAGIRSARAAGLRCLAVGALPAHRAMQAEGLLPSLRGHTLGTLEGVVLRPEERIA